MSINTNLNALHVANNLNGHYGRLSTSVERLSTGLRINSAADDAAGLAIRELMRSDVAALHQGMRNANDAISMLQVADGALAIIDEKLIRMKELAEQAATGTYDSTQRMMINNEFQEMGSEINRIAKSTDFNGIRLLDGSLSGAHDGTGLNSTGRMKIHFGAANDSAEDYYYVEIGKCTTGALGLGDTDQVEEIAVGGYKWLQWATIDRENMTLAVDVPSAFGGQGDMAFTTGIDYYALPVGLKNITVTSNAVTSFFHKPHVCLFTKDGEQLTGPAITGNTPQQGGGTADGSSYWSVANATNAVMNQGIANGIFSPGATYNGTGTTMQQGQIQPGGGLVIDMVTGQNNLTGPDEVIKINEITNDLVFFIGGHNNPGGGCNHYRLQITADLDDELLEKLGAKPRYNPDSIMTINTQEKAQKALVAVDEAIVKKDKIRAHLGALQNRLENTVSNLGIQGESLQASESRISDTDVAREMTEFVRNQILTQSAVAMLGQANSQPQMLTNLLS